MSYGRGQLQIGIQIDDSTVGSKIQGVNSKLNSISTTANTVGSRVGGAFNATLQPITNSGNALNNFGNNTTSVGTKLKSLASNFSNIATNASLFSMSVVGMARSYRDLGFAGVAVERANRRLSLAQESVAKATAKLATVTKSFGADSKQAADARLDLSQAEAQLNIMTQTAAQRQKEYNDIQQDFYLNIIPAGISSIGLLQPVLSKLGGAEGMGGLAGKAKGAGAAMKGFGGLLTGIAFGPVGIVLVGIGAALLAIKTNAFGVTDRLNEIGKAVGDAVPFLRPFLELLKSVVSTFLGMEGAMDLGTAFTNFSNQVTGAFTAVQKAIDAFVLDPVGVISKFFADMGNWIIKNGPTIGKIILNGFIKGVEMYIGAYVTVGKAIWTAIAGGIGIISQWFAKQWIINTQTFTTLGQNIWKAITQGMGDIGKWFTDQIVGGANAAQNFLKSFNPLDPNFNGGKDKDRYTPTSFMGNNNTLRRRNDMGQWVDGPTGRSGGSSQIPLSNTNALKVIDVVVKRIASISTIQATINLVNNTAIKAVDVVAKRIDSLTGLKPNISLQNNTAIKATDVVAKRINSLENIKPQINLQNNKAIKAVDAVAKRIDSINDMNPSVTVRVRYTGIRKFASGGEFTTNGPELIMVGDNPSGKEHVKVTPGAKGYSGTVQSDQPIIINLANITRVDGTDLINSREWKKQVKLEVGRDMDKYG